MTGSASWAFSKERRLDPQITIGPLTDQGGFPLMANAFEGNTAETRTMLPVIESFMTADQLPDVTAVADAGMVAEAEQKDIEAADPTSSRPQALPGDLRAALTKIDNAICGAH